MEQENSTDTEYLDEQHAYRLLYGSFQFSQGSGKLQQAIFRYVHKKYPTYRITTEVQNRIADSITRTVEQLIQTGLHTSDTGTKPLAKIANQEATSFCSKLLLLEEETTYATILEQVALLLIKREVELIRRSNGRPHTNPRSDRFFSNLIHFGFRKHLTGTQEYNDMYADIRELLERKIHSGLLKVADAQRLKLLILFYNERHREHPFKPDWFPQLEEYVTQGHR